MSAQQSLKVSEEHIMVKVSVSSSGTGLKARVCKYIMDNDKEKLEKIYSIVSSSLFISLSYAYAISFLSFPRLFQYDIDSL